MQYIQHLSVFAGYASSTCDRIGGWLVLLAVVFVGLCGACLNLHFQQCCVGSSESSDLVLMQQQPFYASWFMCVLFVHLWIVFVFKLPVCDVLLSWWIELHQAPPAAAAFGKIEHGYVHEQMHIC